eukprot:scaffold11764_cov100-Cylindrotheca_fusiformis.AAC.1
MEPVETGAEHEPRIEGTIISNEAASRYAALRNHSIRFEDAIDPNAERVDKLRKTDIVFGRGKGFQNHPGNKRMRDIVEKYKAQYHTLRRAEKRKMVESVYKEITEGGARFLKKVDGENAWVMVDAPVAIQKVSHTLRCRKPTEMPISEDISAVLPQGFSRGTPAPVDPGSTFSHQRAAIQTLTNNSASMFAHLQGSGPSLASLYGSILPNERSGLAMASFGASRIPTGLELSQLASIHGVRPRNETSGSAMANLGASRMLTGLNTSQLSLLQGAGLGGPSTLPLSVPSNVDYYSQIRHQQHQLLREQMMLQQMEEAAIRNYAMIGVRGSRPQVNPMVERLRSIAEPQQSRKTSKKDQDGAK